MIDNYSCNMAGAIYNFLVRGDYGRGVFVSEHFNIPRASFYRKFAEFKKIIHKDSGRPLPTEEQLKIKELENENRLLKEQIINLQVELSQERRNFSNAIEKLTFLLIVIGLSGRKIAWVMRSAMGVRANHTDILKKAQKYASKATILMEELFHCQGVTVAIDEVFIEGTPVFIAVSPKGLLICNSGTHENCTEKNWTPFLNKMKNLTQTTSDRGLGLMSAINNRDSHLHQSDIFHFKFLLNKELSKMIKGCYALIDREERAKKKLQKCKDSGKNACKDGAKLRRAREKSVASIELFDNLEQAVNMAFEALRFSDGITLNNAKEARQTLDFVAEWIQHIHPRWKKVVNALRDPYLLEFMNISHEAITNIDVNVETPLDREFILATLTQLWEQQNKRRYRGKDVIIPETVEKHLRSCCANLDDIQYELFNILESIPRASSAVECINSIIGFFRYNKKRFNDDFINLVSVVHNISPFLDGKRKGQSPADIENIKLPCEDIYELFEVV